MVDGVGSISPSELEAMRSLSKQRLPIQSKHVEQLLASVDEIRKEAREEALIEAAEEAAKQHERLSNIAGRDPVNAPSYAACVAADIRLAILDLKEA